MTAYRRARARIATMGAAWLASNVASPIHQVVKSVLAWDMPQQFKLSLAELLAPSQEFNETDLAIALVGCGYDPAEAFERSRIPKANQKEMYAIEGRRRGDPRLRRDWRGNPIGPVVTFWAPVTVGDGNRHTPKVLA